MNKFVKLGAQEVVARNREKILNKHDLRSLFWECTLTCNAKCKHCGSNALGKKYEEELSTQEIKDALKQIADDYDSTRIMLNITGGEPLLREDLFEVMCYAKSLGYSWGMVTNGILMNDQNIKKMKLAGMDTISVSIDGLKETHEKFRGIPGSYDLIINNIKKLVEAKFVKHIQVTSVFHKDNIHELEELYKEMCGLGIDSWRLAQMDPIGRGALNDQLLLDGTDLEKLLSFIKRHNKEKMKLTYSCVGYLGDYEMEVRDYPFSCQTGISVASILYNGDLFVCPNVPRRKELIQGNIRKDRFKDIWENRYEVFRRLKRTSCQTCKNCESWRYCLGGAYHTWNFDENRQNRCPYILLKKKQ